MENLRLILKPDVKATLLKMQVGVEYKVLDKHLRQSVVLQRASAMKKSGYYFTTKRIDNDSYSVTRIQ